MEYIKKGLFFSTPIGLYYFLIYCLNSNIPFPLDLGGLPALLTALGILCVFISVIIMAYVTLATLVVFDPLNIGFQKLITVASFDKLKGSKALVVNYIFFYVLNPGMFLVLALCGTDKLDLFISLSIFAFPLLYTYYSVTPKQWLVHGDFKVNKKLLLLAKIYVSFFYLNFFSLVSGYISVKFVLLTFELKSDLATVLTFFCVYFFSFFIFLPPAEKASDARFMELGNKIDLSKEMLRYPMTYVYIFLFMVALLPNVAFKTASSAFHILNVGGKVEREYYYFKDSKIAIPPKIIKKCEGKFCTTKKVKVILSFGGVLYVEDEGNIYSLPNQHLFLIQDIN